MSTPDNVRTTLRVSESTAPNGDPLGHGCGRRAGAVPGRAAARATPEQLGEGLKRLVDEAETPPRANGLIWLSREEPFLQEL